MTTRDVNLINIALMAVAAMVAWEYPLELFFFAYGVLGPLHYLTQISWMYERKWFATSQRDWIWPVAASVLLTAAFLGNEVWGWRSPHVGAELTGPKVSGFHLGSVDLLLWSVIGSTLGAAFCTGAARKVAVAAAVTAAGVGLLQIDGVRLLTSIFLATLVHVFFFTWCFMLFGSLKSKSVSGYVSCLCHLAFGGFLLFGPGNGSETKLPDQLWAQLGGFQQVIAGTSLVLGRPLTAPEAREGVVDAARFMAYAYTYHYLNWFSKTGIIRWHEMPKARALTIVGTWLVSIGLYKYDWKLGFAALLALSLAHVFLEFPLNWRTFVGIAQEFRARAAGRSAPAA
jgi:hypothetical protein